MTETDGLRSQLVKVSQRYADATGISVSTLSTKLLNGGMQLKRISQGGDLNTRKFEQAMAWLSENWPAGTDWPVDVPRPQNERAA